MLMGRHNVSPQTNTLVSSYPIHPIRPILLTRAAQLASASAAARPAAEAPSKQPLLLYGVAKSIDGKLDKLIEQFTKEFADRVATAARREREDDDSIDDDAAGDYLEEEVAEFTVHEEQMIQERARDAANKERSKQLLEKRKKNGILVGVHNGILTPLLPS